MSETWTAERILALAPDASSAKSGRELANARIRLYPYGKRHALSRAPRAADEAVESFPINGFVVLHCHIANDG